MITPDTSSQTESEKVRRDPGSMAFREDSPSDRRHRSGTQGGCALHPRASKLNRLLVDLPQASFIVFRRVWAAVRLGGVLCRHQKSTKNTRTSAWIGREPRAAIGNALSSCKWRTRGRKPRSVPPIGRCRRLSLHTRTKTAATRRLNRAGWWPLLFIDLCRCTGGRPTFFQRDSDVAPRLRIPRVR
jgi:hypothetical protein